MAFSKLDWFKRAVLGSHDLTHADRSVLMVFFSYSDGDGQNARPGRQRIMDDARVSRSKLDGHLNKLLDLGYIILTQKGGNEVRKGWANVYRLGIPRRLMNSNESTRGTSEVSLDDPQGSPSRNQGAPSRDTRVTSTVPQGSPSGGPHQVIDQGIHQVIEIALNSPSLSDAAKKLPVILEETARTDLIESIQLCAETMGSNYSAEEHNNAEDDLRSAIGRYLGDEAQDLWEHEWKVAGIQTTPAGAEQKLNHFIGHMVQTGCPITAMEGAA